MGIFTNLMLFVVSIIIAFLIYIFIQESEFNILTPADAIKKLTNRIDRELGTDEDVYGGDACIFLDSDLYNNRLFTNENQPITAKLIERNEKEVGKGIKLNSGKHFKVKCDECKNYVYKDEKGQCSPYAYDGRYTASNSLGVCTAIGYPKPCEEEAKILQ